jgi:hypothetical protein
MKCPQSQPLPLSLRLVRAFRLSVLALAACLFILLTSAAFAQEEDKDIPLPETKASPAPPDSLLPQINAAIQGVTVPDAAALAKALRVGETPEGGAPPNTLAPIGDVDGNGVPEMVLKWAIPDVAAGAEVAPAPDSSPLWAVYMLSWDGAHWKASRLVTGAEDFHLAMINLGPPVGHAVAVLMRDGEPSVPHPAVFQFKDHLATLLWDAQSDDSRFQPLLQGEVSFRDHEGAPTEMIQTGRADPGFLHVAPSGHRGFEARAIYHWDGKGFIPAKTEYSANQDYTIYRFISALHLHEYASAYALVVPAKFLNADAPTLDAFRHLIQDDWPEFLQNEVFEAPEVPAGTHDDHIFVLPKADGIKVYHPVFSSDGKFLLTGLTSNREATPAEQ